MILMTSKERIEHIRSDRWIAFDRATIVLNRLTSLMEMPKQSRMPGLMVYGSSGIGKTMIAKRMVSQYPMRIPTYPPTHSDLIRPLVPGYPPTCDALR